MGNWKKNVKGYLVSSGITPQAYSSGKIWGNS